MIDRKWLAAAALLLPLSGGALGQEPLEPFTATYNAEWRGMNAGTSTLELVRLGANEYTYRSRIVARGFFRLAFPDAMTQSSTFSIVDGVVRPVTFRADDGTPDSKRAIALDFDWGTMRVKGMAEREPVDEPLKPGTQDSLSVQIALMRELAAGRSPSQFWLISKDEVQAYEYAHEGTALLDTPLGKIETVIYRSHRPGSSRTTRLWIAPSLGFLPLRAQQLRKGKPEFTLNIRSVKRD